MYLHTANRAAQRQASAGARDGVKGKRNDLAARAPLHALVRRQRAEGACEPTGQSQQMRTSYERPYSRLGCTSNNHCLDPTVVAGHDDDVAPVSHDRCHARLAPLSHRNLKTVIGRLNALDPGVVPTRWLVPARCDENHRLGEIDIGNRRKRNRTGVHHGPHVSPPLGRANDDQAPQCRPMEGSIGKRYEWHISSRRHPNQRSSGNRNQAEDCKETYGARNDACQTSSFRNSGTLMTPNVKHQRARATASRAKDELSLRALRCMR